MNIERMQQMIRVLKQVRANTKLAEHFSLSSWICLESGFVTYDSLFGTMQQAIREHKDPLDVVVECGTTACACGFAGMDPWFREQGFKFDFVNDRRGTIYFHQASGWEAVTSFFGLSYEEAAQLFYQESYSELDGDKLLGAVIDRVQQHSNVKNYLR